MCIPTRDIEQGDTLYFAYGFKARAIIAAGEKDDGGVYAAKLAKRYQRPRSATKAAHLAAAHLLLNISKPAVQPSTEVNKLKGTDGDRPGRSKRHKRLPK